MNRITSKPEFMVRSWTCLDVTRLLAVFNIFQYHVRTFLAVKTGLREQTNHIPDCPIHHSGFWLSSTLQWLPVHSCLISQYMLEILLEINILSTRFDSHVLMPGGFCWLKFYLLRCERSMAIISVQKSNMIISDVRFSSIPSRMLFPMNLSNSNVIQLNYTSCVMWYLTGYYNDKLQMMLKLFQ